MPKNQEQLDNSRLFFVAKVFVCLFFSILGFRLWYLQGIQGAYYRDRSENNRIRRIRTVPPRGNVYDREGRVMVRNRPAFNIALMLEDTPDVDKTVERLAQITKREPAQVLEEFRLRRKGRRFEPQVVLYDVSAEELARVKVNAYNLPGVIVTEIPTRAYPYGSTAAQLFGYSREITKEQLESLKSEGYEQGDLIGQAGLEKKFEDVLRGRAGYVDVEVDVRGARREELDIRPDISGDDIYLTIDLDLQMAAEKALGEFSGAVVALDPRNGEVLALASLPSFDANIFSGQMLAREWQQLALDKTKPLRNRAISMIYPPGSTSKLLWSVAGLAERKISPTSLLNCSGSVVLNKHRYHCHKRSGHGSINVETAVTVSCNAFFYQVGHMLGITLMTKYLNMFGYGSLTGIDLPGEEPGTCPSEEWKVKRFGERWYPGDSVPISIGQGYFVATPLQMARMVSVIANGGKLYKPLLVKKIEDSKSGAVREFAPELVSELPIDAKVFELVRSYASQVVQGQRGTGGRARLNGVLAGGKTGTAQVVRLGRTGAKDHAWFISFAPVENPLIAMAVIVEHSGHGGTFAAPVTKAVMEVFFRKLGMLVEPEAEGEAPLASAEPVEVTDDEEYAD